MYQYKFECGDRVLLRESSKTSGLPVLIVKDTKLVDGEMIVLVQYAKYRKIEMLSYPATMLAPTPGTLFISVVAALHEWSTAFRRRIVIRCRNVLAWRPFAATQEPLDLPQWESSWRTFKK